MGEIKYEETRKKVFTTQKGKGKRKKVVQQHTSIISIGKSRKRNKDTEMIGTTFGMQITADIFKDEQHTSITNVFVDQRIATLFGDGVTEMTN